VLTTLPARGEAARRLPESAIIIAFAVRRPGKQCDAIGFLAGSSSLPTPLTDTRDHEVRNFVFATAGLALVVLSAYASVLDAVERPNVVILFADDK
jgi:hypothetical protein